ncbi:amastin-like surface protein-like protein [Leptomonas pyrrhocoris]|uniref:Amastin-like surface protein-like protein n=1 Tax=Leptomonas pyrrhocoris TaxID=157538 RepID=A0A0M9FZP8_LEPPY|nr:amastin-like surface protein-like protein [Leptomonas pyrrhocoris]XP_015657626.1 amastin-like surface protein-like protein [Leptomonas pyrrhocoris]KPA79186.1 amastin-like surface protein-like protein [Leptomonas pyrrhocoris]KPA79187.1 amastin-like surface protein-like protein [Leptomonas pyrrhocoris]|eukprot:XP_015657625.1 amastin-like surface protein-like protein [Leptomonas pyrrhocoris]
MGLLPPFVGAVIFCALQFTVFLFVLVSTPIDQLKFKGSDACWTFFGAKIKCSNAKRSATGIEAFGCAHRRNNMNGGAAFAIFSICTTLAALVFGILMLLRIPCAVLIPLILTCLSVLTILISWACVAGVYSERMCSTSTSNGVKASAFMDYGAGFGLMVTAWCLQIINVVVLVLVSFF